jgi:hypothetical protein
VKLIFLPKKISARKMIDFFYAMPDTANIRGERRIVVVPQERFQHWPSLVWGGGRSDSDKRTVSSAITLLTEKMRKRMARAGWL